MYAYDVMFIDVEKGLSNLISNPGRGFLHFT